MTEPAENATVLDTTVLSNFAQVNHIELLLPLPRLVTVPAVRDELEAGTETHPYLEHALNALDDDIAVYTLSAEATDVENNPLETLDPGEAQALASAEATDGTVVTDDGDARATANRRGIDLTGSIGILVRSVEDERISAETADRYLKRWIDEAGFRSPARDFDAFL